MKKLLCLLVLAASACQQQAPTNQLTVSEPAPAAQVAAAAAPAPGATPARNLSVADPLNPAPAVRAALRSYDFSRLLQTVHPDAAADLTFASHAQNGFYGPDHYRIEMALTDVRRDEREPGLYHVRGKSRYKKIITPFAGTVRFTQLIDQPGFSERDQAELTASGVAEEELPTVVAQQPNYFTALGTFELAEDSTHRGAGTYRGQVALDYFVDQETGDLFIESLDQRNSRHRTGTQGGGVKYEGTWTSQTTGKTNPVVWVDNIFGYAPEPHIFNDFLIGERDVDFNPKYAKLGWNHYWENDEWWAESPKPSLSL